MSALAAEIAKFRQWAIVRQSPDYRPDEFSHFDSEWECDYPDWQDFYTAVDSFLETAGHRTLTAEELEQLLYALARDNEDEVILETFEKFPAVAAQIIQAAVSFPDTDARWQAAVLAGHISSAAIVRRFLDDEDEYVRHRAGFALRDMDASLPTAKSARSPDERAKLKRVIAERDLCGLANDTKWNEFISGIRARQDWRPSYRYKCIDGPSSCWEVEWFYHLPFPLMSVEWLDLAFLQEARAHRLPPHVHVTDHSPWLEELLRRVGLEYQKGTIMIRIFGYSPRSLDLFDV